MLHERREGALGGCPEVGGRTILQEGLVVALGWALWVPVAALFTELISQFELSRFKFLPNSLGQLKVVS